MRKPDEIKFMELLAFLWAALGGALVWPVAWLF